MKRLLCTLALVLGLLASPPAIAYQVSLPNTFVNGQVIDATMVMANYNAIVQAINGGIDHTNVNATVGFWASDIQPTTPGSATAGGTVAWIFPNSLQLSSAAASMPVCTDANKTLTTSCSSAAVVTNVAAAAPLSSSGGSTPTISLTGTVGIANGGTANTSYTTNSCLRYNGTAFASAAGDCVYQVTAGTNMNVTGASQAPVVAVVSSPTFTNITANALFFYTTATTCGGGTTGSIGSTNIAGPQGVNASGILIRCGSTNFASADTSGNWGFTGNVTAANFFNGSSLRYKTDWHPFRHFDAIDVIMHEQFGTYRYRRAYGDPQDLNVGFIAEHTPAWVAGPKHNREDIKAQTNINAVAIQQLVHRVKQLEREVSALKHER